jgi:hypothetical protein
MHLPQLSELRQEPGVVLSRAEQRRVISYATSLHITFSTDSHIPHAELLSIGLFPLKKGTEPRSCHFDEST